MRSSGGMILRSTEARSPPAGGHRPSCTTVPYICPVVCLMVPGEGSPGAAAPSVLRFNSDAGEVRWKQQQAR
jgi:hypothetical protein